MSRGPLTLSLSRVGERGPAETPVRPRFNRVALLSTVCQTRYGLAPAGFNSRYGAAMTVFRRLLAAPVVALALVVLPLLPAHAQNAAKAQKQDAPVTIMAFGDSLAHGYGLPEGEPFPGQLEAALKDQGYAVEVINAGSSGDTSKSGRSRLSWVLQDRVDAAIVVLGANDALRGIDPAVTRENLDAVLQTLREQGVATLLAGMKAPRNMGQQYVQEFDSLYPELARKHGVLFYPFFLKGVAQRPELNQSDGIHPNAKGVRVIVDKILPKVEQLIERVRSNAAS